MACWGVICCSICGLSLPKLFATICSTHVDETAKNLDAAMAMFAQLPRRKVDPVVGSVSETPRTAVRAPRNFFVADTNDVSCNKHTRDQCFFLPNETYQAYAEYAERLDGCVCPFRPTVSRLSDPEQYLGGVPSSSKSETKNGKWSTLGCSGRRTIHHGLFWP